MSVGERGAVVEGSKVVAVFRNLPGIDSAFLADVLSDAVLTKALITGNILA